MIGYYNYTVLLTFLGLLSSVFGMAQVMDGHFRIAIFCLAFSGLCDTFDGMVARTKKNRTEDEKLYGIQLDSLCDVVCFGLFPAMIGHMLGVRGIVGGLVIGYYCVCSVTRLAFFNVLETNRQMGATNEEKVYHGLPITSIAVILPLSFLLEFLMPEGAFSILLTVILFVVGTCFIMDFHIKRPSGAVIGLMIAVVACAVCTILLFSEYHVIRAPVRDMPLISQFSEGCNDK